MGYILYDKGMTEIRQAHGDFGAPTDILDLPYKDTHIFVKELLAATLAIGWICKHIGGEHNVEMVIAVDNTAAAGVLRRLYSSTDLGCELVSRILIALADKHTLRVVTLRSEDNPSDPLTRNRALCPVRNAKLREILTDFELGRHIKAWPKDNVHRIHREADAPMDGDESEDEGQDADAALVDNALPDDDVPACI